THWRMTPALKTTKLPPTTSSTEVVISLAGTRSLLMVTVGSSFLSMTLKTDLWPCGLLANRSRAHEHPPTQPIALYPEVRVGHRFCCTFLPTYTCQASGTMGILLLCLWLLQYQHAATMLPTTPPPSDRAWRCSAVHFVMGDWS